MLVALRTWSIWIKNFLVSPMVFKDRVTTHFDFEFSLLNPAGIPPAELDGIVGRTFPEVVDGDFVDASSSKPSANV